MLTNMMWYVYLYFMCIYSLSNLITSQYKNIISLPEISDCPRENFACVGDMSVCAQMNSHLINGPFYEPLVRLRRHMAPNGFNSNKLIKWM